VKRFLDAVRPDAVALAELELWPNFARACAARGIPLAVINGRLSERSFKGYRLGRAFIGRYFRGLTFAAVQDDAYAQRFMAMGVARERCHVAGTMKWDAADTRLPVAGAAELARELGIDASRPLVVAGSTEPGEPALLHRSLPEGVQLLCAPRKPEWFDEAQRDLPGCVRRTMSRGGAAGSSVAPAPPSRFLLDTIGELRKAYALADIVVVGRSFGQLYGSDPMEPAALGKPIIIGPRSADFATTVAAMLEDQAIIQTDAANLPAVLRRLLDDPAARAAMGQRALECVRRHQGATERHAALLLPLLASRRSPRP
jgi:3-deoxy-D-manno-octulosonic-acid transferase